MRNYSELLPQSRSATLEFGWLLIFTYRSLNSRYKPSASCIFFGNQTHVGASFIALAPTFVTKVRARSCRCSSFPNRTRFAGLQFSFGCKLGNCGIYTVSIFQKERNTKRCVSLFGDADPNGICITCGQVLSNVRETLEEGELEPQIY